MNQVPGKEYPSCQKCGFHKMKVDNNIQCPNCDTSSAPSGIVSRTKDPGTKGFVKKTIKGTDGKDYEIMVLDTKDEPLEPSDFDAEPLATPITGPQVTAMAHEQEQLKDHPELILKALRLVFEQHPARTLSEFKRLKKVRDQIDKLEFLITQIKES